MKQFHPGRFQRRDRFLHFCAGVNRVDIQHDHQGSLPLLLRRCVRGLSRQLPDKSQEKGAVQHTDFFLRHTVLSCPFRQGLPGLLGLPGRLGRLRPFSLTLRQAGSTLELKATGCRSGSSRSICRKGRSSTRTSCMTSCITTMSMKTCSGRRGASSSRCERRTQSGPDRRGRSIWVSTPASGWRRRSQGSRRSSRRRSMPSLPGVSS